MQNSKITSKQADATLAKLTSVMHRNTALATSTPIAAGPSATYTMPQAPAPATAPAKPKAAASSVARETRSGIRLRAEDTARIREVIQAGLSFQETLTTVDVIRLALAAYDPKRLTATDIATLWNKDGRSARARGGER